MAMISDVGGPIASGTTFYYNLGNIGSSNSFAPTNSFGPGPDAVSKLVQSWTPSNVIAVGDLAYNVGASTLVDASIGQYYGNFIYPYPSPAYSKDPYLEIGGKAINRGQKAWPYNLYDFPKGFPNPLNGRQGGSPTKTNRFWASLGNHDYGQEVGYGQPGVTPYTMLGQATGTPIGPSSTTSLRSSIDYFVPFLENPNLLGNDKNRLNIGNLDKSGNSGTYYSIKLGGSAQSPLIEVFQLDSERLNVNAGYEEWNPASQDGMKTKVEPYKNKDGLLISYEDKIDDNENLGYDPTIPYDSNNPNTVPLAGTTTDPNNGYKQYQWLKDSLAKSNATWKIITAHHPTYGSGRWGDEQPDSHMSNPYLQRLLNALPKGSFDAVYCGESHYYERTLESKTGGIGLGIPFIVQGNAGRNLERKIQIPYGGSVYNPPIGGFDEKNNPNPNKRALAAGALLDSAPVMVGTSGLSGSPKEQKDNYVNGLYGYGFGAVKVAADDNYLLTNYQETPVVDPAIANHLRNGIAPEAGFRFTTPNDWIPNPKSSSFDTEKDLARFKLSITNGVVTGVTLLAGGNGYMSSKGGNYVVRGFNIYGNNVDIKKPWLKTAQVDLIFRGGSLVDVKLTDGGQAYQLAVISALENNDATTTDAIKDPDKELVVGINYNLNETQYGVRDPLLYNDWYMTTDTQASVVMTGKPGQAGTLQVQMLAKSAQARRLLSGGLKPTTGYSGTGAQRFSSAAQSGNFQLFDNGQLIASGNLSNGSWSGQVDKLPSPRTILSYTFDGDPITSYNVNFKASQGTVRATTSPNRSSGVGAMLKRSTPTTLQTTAHRTPTFASTELGQERLSRNTLMSNPLLAAQPPLL